jgi:hypothetical protein
MTMLDPWHDAATIAARLTAPMARLVVLIGAESWCERCRTLKPAFEAMALQREGQDETWIWLDLEDHADFLDGFIPDDLPILMQYSGADLSGALVGRAVTASAFASPVAGPSLTGLPDLRVRLMATDWAV